MERDDFQPKKATKVDISTHTLTWSVTQIAVICVLGNVISTHTLTWSVTLVTGYNKPVTLISTHTLTWSVTLCS